MRKTIVHFGGMVLCTDAMMESTKELEVHEKSDVVPALVPKKKFDCVPQSNHEICMKCFFFLEVH